MKPYDYRKDIANSKSEVKLPIKQKTQFNLKDSKLDTKREDRESSAGVHFADLYGLCQRRFYFKYCLGIEPAYTDKALIAGSAFHLTKATWYTTNGDFEESVCVGIDFVDSKKDDFYSLDDYQYARNRLEPMFRNWVITYGESDLKNYTVVGVEKEFRLPIPFTPGFVTTQRHDALLLDKKTGKIITGETKTSSTSLDFTFNSVRTSSQVSAYIWGGYKILGKKYAGLMVDVTYWSTRSKNEGTIQSRRSEILTKTPYQIKQMQLDMASLLNEVQAKINALKTGTLPEFLFRRSTYYCYAYFRRCPYADICSMNTKEALKRKGDNLKILSGERALNTMTYDTYYFGEGPLG